MTRKQLAVIAAIPCAIGLVWLGLRPETSSPESGVPGNAGEKERSSRHPATDSAVVKFSQPRYPITPSASAPPGRWKGEYPADALQKADAMRPGKLRDRLLQQTVKEWAAKSPDEAKKWVEDRKDPVERERLLQAIHGNLNAADALPSERQIVEKLGLAVEQLNLDESQSHGVEDFTDEWAQVNLSAAREWVLGQPAGEVRDELLSRIALMQAKSDPASAARLVTDSIPAGSVHDEAVISVLHQWTLKDPAAAAAWAEAFPAGPLKARAQKELSRPSIAPAMP
jgi:hypothetical protein